MSARIHLTTYFRLLCLATALATISLLDVSKNGVEAPSANAQSMAVRAVRADISETALRGLTAGWTEDQPLYCSRFVRQIFENVFSEDAYEIRGLYFGMTANDTEYRWKHQGKLRSYSTVIENGGLRQGDVVFQSWGEPGHVGIVVNKNGVLMIAENTVRYGYSIDHRTRRTDFRALTSLTGFSY
jgi:hypothetical protein